MAKEDAENPEGAVEGSRERRAGLSLLVGRIPSYGAAPWPIQVVKVSTYICLVASLA